jgi:hypothetical protein
MSKRDSVRVVEEFWAAVWKARDPEAIDRFVVDEFVLTTGGVEVVSRAASKEWAGQFMGRITDLEFEVVETFQNEDGSRVASRWRITGCSAPRPTGGRSRSPARPCGRCGRTGSCCTTGSNEARGSCSSG